MQTTEAIVINWKAHFTQDFLISEFRSLCSKWDNYHLVDCFPCSFLEEWLYPVLKEVLKMGSAVGSTIIDAWKKGFFVLKAFAAVVTETDAIITAANLSIEG
jgi:hypothetical protein